MKLKTFFELMEREFQIRKVETNELLFDSYDDGYSIFEKYKDFKIVGFGVISKTEINEYQTVTIVPGVIVYID